MEKFEKRELKRKSENLSDWYNDVVQKAELADYGPVRGTMIIRPYGYAIWERVQTVFNGLMSTADVQNAYFPLFIPYKFLQKEKEHVEGFSPELALVTIGGGEKLAEPLVVRPTSETIMYDMYSKWIKSWRDLPLKLNQWNNIVRWEKRTYLFLRTMEFLWQEGHTAHAAEKEADDMVMLALEWYRKLHEEFYAIPVMIGIKSAAEKFAGAVNTYGVEALMPDGKALQCATSHMLGQNFSTAFNIQYQDKEGKNQYVWQTSWGTSTRSLGGLFLMHGDDNGLILPPKIAPYQIVIIPIHKSGESNADLIEHITRLADDLKKQGLRVYCDNRENQSVGRKFNEWEVKGVPLRLEIGNRELQDKTATAVRRDTGEKRMVHSKDFYKTIEITLDEIQANLFAKANQFLHENTHEVKNYNEFKEIMFTNRGYIKAYWCGDVACEAKIKEETKATTRLHPLSESKESGKCVYCGKESNEIWYFAQSY